jgi:epoxyqueuosine reductase
LERAVAANTRLGFIGKNTCFIHPKQGSFFLLGEIISTHDFTESSPQEIRPSNNARDKESGGCGTCKRCQVHCPTGALDEDYRIDARKCLSWWTIENRGPIPKEYWPWIGRYVYGCDICQLVCPYNRGLKVKESTASLVKIKTEIDLFEMATLTQESYERLFGGTPTTRAKREGLVRNALIAMYVTKDPRLPQALDHNSDATHVAITSTMETIKGSN